MNDHKNGKFKNNMYVIVPICTSPSFLFPSSAGHNDTLGLQASTIKRKTMVTGI